MLRIGPATYYNAMPTIFGYFFIDGGFALTFIEAWLFGYICKRIYIVAKNGNVYFISVFILLFIQICNSSTRWFFYSPDYCLAMIYLRLIMTQTNDTGNIVIPHSLRGLE